MLPFNAGAVILGPLAAVSSGHLVAILAVAGVVTFREKWGARGGSDRLVAPRTCRWCWCGVAGCVDGMNFFRDGMEMLICAAAGEELGSVVCGGEDRRDCGRRQSTEMVVGAACGMGANIWAWYVLPLGEALFN